MKVNDLKELRNERHMDRVNFDLDSPLFKRACFNLGIETRDCEKRTYDSFCEKGLSQ